MATLVAPIQVIILVIALIFCSLFWSQTWFSYHPMFMICGYLAFMSNAIFYELWGSKHWVHMILQILCLLCVDFAWYVIWSNKNMAKKEHYTSWHGQISVICLTITNLQVIGSSVML